MHKTFHSNMYTSLTFEIFTLKPPKLLSYIGVDILLASVRNISNHMIEIRLD
jgi:hypothetical protein